MRQRDRQRHQLRRLRTGEPEHHPLIPGPLPIQPIRRLTRTGLDRRVHPLRDIRRLRPDRHRHPTRRPIETLLRRVITDPKDRLPHNRRNIRIRRRRHLTSHMHLTSRDQRLHRHPRRRIRPDQRIQHPITNLISDLVRVTLSHRLRRKQAPRHGAPSLLAHRIFGRVYGQPVTVAQPAAGS